MVSLSGMAHDTPGPHCVPIAEAAAHLDMREATIINMITARTLAGYVDWGEVEAKLLPARRPRQ